MPDKEAKPGLLEELRSQVERHREEERRKAEEQRAREQCYQSFLRPAMLRAHGFFTELAEYLGVVSPQLNARYPLDPTDPEGVELAQADYWYDYDDRDSPRHISIGARCSLARPIEFYLPTRDAALNHAELLNKMDFFHHCKYKRDAWHEICGGTFILEGPMRVNVALLADTEKRCITVALRNLESQPHKLYRFQPGEIDEALLERIAQVLLRQEQTLVEVELHEDVRETLRRRVEEEKRRSELELSLALDEMEQRKQAEEEARFINRAKKAIVNLVNGIGT